MRFGRKWVVGGALVGALGVMAAAWAHGGPGGAEQGGHGMRGHGGGQGMGMQHGMAGMGGMGGMHGMGMHGGAASLEATKDALKLSAEQLPSWEKYAASVNRQAEARERMRSAMHSGTVEHGAMHETMAAFRREAAKEIAQAREALIAVLSAEQRQVFEQPRPGRSMAQGGGHRH